jgi:hypothetical protein
MNTTICMISKEDLPKYEMIKKDALTNSADIYNRRVDIERALKLGNNEHQKVKIIFETTEGTMAVETTVWEVTQNYLILKSNMALPVRCVHRIEFFE